MIKSKKLLTSLALVSALSACGQSELKSTQVVNESQTAEVDRSTTPNVVLFYIDDLG